MFIPRRTSTGTVSIYRRLRKQLAAVNAIASTALTNALADDESDIQTAQTANTALQTAQAAQAAATAITQTIIKLPSIYNITNSQPAIFYLAVRPSGKFAICLDVTIVGTPTNHTPAYALAKRTISFYSTDTAPYAQMAGPATTNIGNIPLTINAAFDIVNNIYQPIISVSNSSGQTCYISGTIILSYIQHP